ncbi:MAG: ornithine carbamoyltransferase [Candidatus Micrarchaeota archaeon]|nr:ornithine carbamoyltransferase [Candidatus Micrarchaeota archaeon]
MNLLSARDLSRKQIEEIFLVADSLEHQKYFQLNGRKVLGLLFEKASTRTRVSFEAAMAQLGGSSVYIDKSTSQLSRGESIADTARVLSLYLDFVAARLYRQEDLEEFAKHSKVPVINALTDVEHPTQALADVYTIRKVFGKVSGLRIAFVGDIKNNTCNSLMAVATRMGAGMALVGPKGYSPDAGFIKDARKHGKVDISNDMRKGLAGADVIYTDTFVSMGMEKQAEKRRRLFRRYIVDDRALSYAKRNCKVMHCLPAHRGEEIAANVIDGGRSIVWQQALNKLVIEKAILIYLSRNS